MTTQELTEQINFWASTADPQSGENLDRLYIHYCEMFLQYVGDLPNFVLLDNKGRIKLV